MIQITEGMWVFAYTQGSNAGAEYPYVMLSCWTGLPEKVCYRALERAAERGLIEYGVSLRTGWLTEKGKAVLSVS